jgi:hypothetical protein
MGVADLSTVASAKEEDRVSGRRMIWRLHILLNRSSPAILQFFYKQISAP